MTGSRTTTPTPTEDPCLCFSLRKAARTISREYDQHLKPAGLKTTQFTLLSMTASRGPLSITELAEQLGMERTSLSRTLRPLEAKGYVQVSPEGYKRTRLVEITRAGRRQLETALPLWAQAQRTVQTRLGVEQASELRELLSLTEP